MFQQTLSSQGCACVVHVKRVYNRQASSCFLGHKLPLYLSFRKQRSNASPRGALSQIGLHPVFHCCVLGDQHRPQPGTHLAYEEIANHFKSTCVGRRTLVAAARTPVEEAQRVSVPDTAPTQVRPGEPLCSAAVAVRFGKRCSLEQAGKSPSKHNV